MLNLLVGYLIYLKVNLPKMSVPILIDQGDSDEFLIEQLKPDNLVRVAQERKLSFEYRLQQGYDHSYFFVSSFIEEHLSFHAQHLF